MIQGSLRGLGRIVENHQVGVGARDDGISAALIIAEFDERGIAVQHFDHSSHLPVRKTFLWAVGQKRH